MSFLLQHTAAHCNTLQHTATQSINHLMIESRHRTQVLTASRHTATLQEQVEFVCVFVFVAPVFRELWQ